MRMNTTLVINSKGGSGKTTVATNLASYFAAHDIPTTVMDYDPHAQYPAVGGGEPGPQLDAGVSTARAVSQFARFAVPDADQRFGRVRQSRGGGNRDFRNGPFRGSCGMRGIHADRRMGGQAAGSRGVRGRKDHRSREQALGGKDPEIGRASCRERV